MVVQELIAKLGFHVDQGGLNSVDNALGNFAKKLTIAAAGIYAVKKAVEATVWGITESINAAAQKEDVTTQFKVMLGDLEAAKYLYQEINQYAAVSPFETAGLADNVRMMMSFGMSAKNAFADVKVLGDVALGSQTKLNSLALAYSQTKAAGRLTGNDLLQYINAGFNPLEYIAKKTGKSADYWKQEMSKGKVSFDMVRQAFVDATSAGGKFYKGAEEGSKTWNGMMSTLRDNIRMLGAELGEKVLPTLKAILEAFFVVWPTVEGAFRSMSDAIGIFVEGGPQAITIAAAIAAAFGTIADVVTTVLTTLQLFYAIFDTVSVGVSLLISVVFDAVMSVGKVVSMVFRDIFKGVAAVGEQLGIKSLKRWGTNQAASMDIGYEVGDLTKGTWDASKRDMNSSWGKFVDLGQQIGKDTQGAGPMRGSAAIDAILAKGASNQPVKITNNNQTNNLTINADNPIKSMGESAASEFFQSAFIQIRHATA